MVDVAVRTEPEALAMQREAIGRALADLCARNLGDDHSPVGEAIRYSLLGEGKRMRGNPLSLRLRGRWRHRRRLGTRGGDRGRACVFARARRPPVHGRRRRASRTPDRCIAYKASRRRPAAGLAMVPAAARSAAESARALGLDEQTTGEIVADLMRASGRRGHDRRAAARPRGRGSARSLWLIWSGSTAPRRGR
jgi:farnesyl diphosphate synthase/geranylgeranyl diphosphate synthase type II